MGYKSFSFQVIARVVLVLANLICIAYIFARTELFFTQLILAIILCFQIYNLIRFVTQTNRELARFLQAIRHKDYSVDYFSNQSQKGVAFGELYTSFEEVIHSYKKAEAQRESQYHYFKLIIEHVNVGILSLNTRNEIVLINKAVEKLLQIDPVVSWSQLQSKRFQFTQAIDAFTRPVSQLIEVPVEDELKQFSVEVNQVTMLGETLRIITFGDIQNELAEKELSTWQKLIRILTHEIMNSVTPVVSLTETMLMILEEEDGQQKALAQLTEDNIADIRFSLKTIQKRSGGILHFLNDYRKLTRIPIPKLEKIQVAELIKSVAKLMQGELNNCHVSLLIQPIQAGLTIEADSKLMEQVVINLLTNSLQALEEITNPTIEVKAYSNKSHVIIEVRDNGNGIDTDKLDSIFIPFYSTKEQGSGIGLSISKQIMHLHRGAIKVISQKGQYTIFQLHFPIH